MIEESKALFYFTAKSIQ